MDENEFLKEVISYCAIENEEDMPLVKTLIEYANAYMQGAGIAKCYEDARYKMAVYKIVAHEYDCRGGTLGTLVTALINQMKVAPYGRI